MTHRKTFLKSALAGALALGALAGSAGAASATDFRFSWSTPQGTFILGPNGSHYAPAHVPPRHVQAPRHEGPRHASPRHVAPRYQLEPRAARRVLRQAGFRDISFLRERRDAYVFEALGQRGYRRVAVDKFSGQIIWHPGRG